MSERPVRATFGTRRLRGVVAASLGALVVQAAPAEPHAPGAGTSRTVAIPAPAPAEAVDRSMQARSRRPVFGTEDLALVRRASTRTDGRGARTDRRGKETPERRVTLEAPTALTVLRFTPHVVLTWTHDARLTTGYEIERAMGGGPFRRIGTPGRAARTFRDPASAAGVMCVYRIRAVGNSVVSPYSQEVVVFAEPDRPASPRGRSGAAGR